MKRCFVALHIRDEARAAIAGVQKELARLRLGAKEKLRLTRAENLHLTVKFLGATGDEQVDDVRAALELAAGASRPAKAELFGIGAFPGADRPRAIYAAVGPGREALVQLAARVDEACAELGFAREERPRVPHVTIARVEDARVNGALTQLIESRAPVPLGPVDAGALVLYESSLQPGGSVYMPLATVPLTG